jgi:hypothetical protein
MQGVAMEDVVHFSEEQFCSISQVPGQTAVTAEIERVD